MIARGARRAPTRSSSVAHGAIGRASRLLARGERLGARGRPVVDRDPEAVVGDVEGEVLAHHAEPDQADLRLTCHPPNALLPCGADVAQPQPAEQSRADPFREEADDRAAAASASAFGVRYSEVDYQGIVYFAHYATYFDVGDPRVLPRLPYDYTAIRKTTGTDFNIVRSVVEYRRPLRFDERSRSRSRSAGSAAPA